MGVRAGGSLAGNDSSLASSTIAPGSGCLLLECAAATIPSPVGRLAGARRNPGINLSQLSRRRHAPPRVHSLSLGNLWHPLCTLLVNPPWSGGEPTSRSARPGRGG